MSDSVTSTEGSASEPSVRNASHRGRVSKVAVAFTAAVLFGIIAAFTYGLLIWPTPYLIIHEKGDVYRVNRFTGIREWSTEKGWMTEEQMQAQAQTEAAQEAAFWQAKSAAVLSQFKAITVDDNARGELNKLVIYNATDWELAPTDFYNTLVEYYVTDRGQERFICKTEVRNDFLRPRTRTELDLSPRYGPKVPTEVDALPAGTNFVQRITITFNTASNKSLSNDDKYIKLQPPFVLKKDRAWTQIDPAANEESESP